MSPSSLSSKSSAYHPPQTGLLSYLPSSWVPYAELVRLDRPTGILYFYLPFLFGLLYAACVAQPITPPSSLFTTHIPLFISIVLLRGAAVAWNDVVDRDLDRQVARCRFRPVARGAVSQTNGVAFAAAHMLIWSLILYHLPTQCVYYSIPYAILHVLYPLSKRVTDYAPLFLGLTFAWGVFVSGAALGADPVTLWSEKSWFSLMGLL
ncbi:MAG: hypothetical protein Q9187_004600, partial [Circinaria calcarea]